MDYERGILTEMNPGLCTTLVVIGDNFKPLQDKWIMKGHTHMKWTQD